MIDEARLSGMIAESPSDAETYPVGSFWRVRLFHSGGAGNPVVYEANAEVLAVDNERAMNVQIRVTERGGVNTRWVRPGFLLRRLD
jgi:hypothetical protein